MRRPRRTALVITACLAVAGATHVIRGQLARAVSTDFKEFAITRSEASESSSPYPIQRVVFEAQRADGSRATGEATPTGDLEHAASRFVWLSRANPRESE